jgi:sugar lactone lactonase YvrE
VKRSRAAPLVTVALIGALVLAPAARAAEVRLFLTQSQEAFRAGELDSISVDPLGILRLAHRAERLAAIEEPFLLSAAALPGGKGWVIGTGNSGRVLRLDGDGRIETLFTTEEAEVFAVWADAKGVVYAGSSPDGKVYRHADGKTDVLFDPDQTYIWDVEGDGKGGLLVATGTEGKLFRVDSDGSGKVLYDSDDAHLRSIGVIGDGSFLVGTAGLGLVLRVSAEGEARTVYDASAPEVVAFAPDGAGGAYFAVIASEASLIDLGGDRSRTEDKNGDKKEGEENGDDEENGDEGTAEVSFGSSDSLTSGSRPSGFRGARSEVLRWTPSAGAQSVWKFTDETVYSLLVEDGRLWVGTGLEGKLYSHQNERMMLEKDVDQSQIVALLPGAAGPVFATTNGAALFRFTKGMERNGTLTSDVFDAGLQSTFGTLHWRGVEPDGTKVRFSARGGMSALPDSTWTDWSAPSQGHEISLRGLDASRYLQWRAELESASEKSPEVHAVEISYLQSNQPPQLDELAVLEPGQILVPSNFNPQNQVFEPAYPNREGIFTTLAENKDNRGLKPLWKRGFRTVRWTARDPNEDELTYTVDVRRENDDAGWLSMEDELEEERYSFDATVLPDGLYRFRVTVSDERGNDGAAGATATRTSEAVVIDHTPPVIAKVESNGGALRVEIEDPWNIVREAVTSVDAAPWENAKVDDGLLDSRRETLVLEPEKGARLLLLRLTDAAYNVMTYDLSQQLEGRR